jgi:hypothetical protein
MEKLQRGSKKKLQLDAEQMDWLRKILSSNFKLSKREHFVVGMVLENESYHANHQYHLTKIRDRYKLNHI